ncbi:glutamyl-tRNA synthetase [Aspergillus terreus]|uniref:Glutamyl-tRNA synthetase n=1 Tax=Aspergillus terreus TaxID=33178 RepID=A0A5M3YY05_ASPTE|nr:hypothetical protein ATETN484_0005036700 [Aspergillus terreus]GFF17032.1 glutamyl-tRNA synthetase [Aspergillus terreus]
MDKFTKALQLIDAAHAEDPNTITPPSSTTPVPYELHYANKMTKYLTLRDPAASELLRLAIRAQHLRRWEVPRASFPATKAGYHAWRAHLQKRQAELVEGMCVAAGYTAAEAGRVGALVRKEGLRAGSDPETQVLEDVACLVFLDDQFEGFEAEKQYEEEKVLGILRKTWAKMSEPGRELALGIEMSERARGLVEKALQG